VEHSYLLGTRADDESLQATRCPGGAEQGQGAAADFDDAEGEAMPDVVRPLRWDEIKSFFRAEAVRLFRTLPS
jgi:hypothetical protein